MFLTYFLNSNKNNNNNNVYLYSPLSYNKLTMTILKIELARVLAAPPIAIRAELLKAWLALTLVKQYQNQYVVKVLNVG